MDDLIKSGGRYGLKIREPLKLIEIPRYPKASDIHRLVEDYSGKDYDKLDLLLFACTKNTARDFYSEIKRFYQKLGIPT